MKQFTNVIANFIKSFIFGSIFCFVLYVLTIIVVPWFPAFFKAINTLFTQTYGDVTKIYSESIASFIDTLFKNESVIITIIGLFFLIGFTIYFIDRTIGRNHLSIRKAPSFLFRSGCVVLDRGVFFWLVLSLIAVAIIPLLSKVFNSSILTDYTKFLFSHIDYVLSFTALVIAPVLAAISLMFFKGTIIYHLIAELLSLDSSIGRIKIRVWTHSGDGLFFSTDGSMAKVNDSGTVTVFESTEE